MRASEPFFKSSIPRESTGGRHPEHEVNALLAKTSDTDSENIMKALEDRALVKFQSRYLFVKVEYAKDSEESKNWGVSGAPTILIVDPSTEAGPKGMIDRLYGKRTVRQLRSTLNKGPTLTGKGRVSSRQR